MAYRKFDTSTWQDPWFEDLSPRAKLGFIYFWTNEICTPSGIYEISEKRIKFDLGYGIDTISQELKPKILWYPDKKIVWIRNFFKHQCQNGKFAVAAINSVKDNTFKLQLFTQYNKKILTKYKIKTPAKIDTVSIPYPTETEQNRTEQIQKKRVKEKKNSFTPPSPQEVIDYFLENNFSKALAKKAWRYYEAGGWRDARGQPVKNWKQKMISVWFKNNESNGESNGTNFSKNDDREATDFPARDLQIPVSS